MAVYTEAPNMTVAVTTAVSDSVPRLEGGVFFSGRNARERYLSPQYTRTRQRFRGPRNSYLINLMHSQLRFMIFKLYERYEIIRTNYERNANILDSGEAPASIESGTTAENQTPLDVPGFEEVVADLQILLRRIELLERKR